MSKNAILATGHYKCGNVKWNIFHKTKHDYIFLKTAIKTGIDISFNHFDIAAL